MSIQIKSDFVGYNRNFFALFSENGTYETLGYQTRSEMTGKLYASLDDFFEAEPEAEEFRWQPPEEHTLRATFQKMQPNEVYHVLVTLAGDVFRQKAFAASWAEPLHAILRLLVGDWRDCWNARVKRRR